MGKGSNQWHGLEWARNIIRNNRTHALNFSTFIRQPRIWTCRVRVWYQTWRIGHTHTHTHATHTTHHTHHTHTTHTPHTHTTHTPHTHHTHTQITSTILSIKHSSFTVICMERNHHSQSQINRNYFMKIQKPRKPTGNRSTQIHYCSNVPFSSLRSTIQNRGTQYQSHRCQHSHAKIGIVMDLLWFSLYNRLRYNTAIQCQYQYQYWQDFKTKWLIHAHLWVQLQSYSCPNSFSCFD